MYIAPLPVVHFKKNHTLVQIPMSLLLSLGEDKWSKKQTFASLMKRSAWGGAFFRAQIGPGSRLLRNNLYALIPIVVISGEDAPMTRSTGAAQRKQTTGLSRQREEEKKKIFQIDRKPTDNIT